MTPDWLAEFEREEWIELFRPILNPDLLPSDRYESIQQFNEGVKMLRHTDEQKRDYRLSIKDGMTLIRMIGSNVEIAQKTERDLGDVVMFLEAFQHPKFVDAIVDQYAECPPRQRTDLLRLLACQDPKLVAPKLRLLIEEHGFPNVYPRVFWKLGKHTEELSEYIVAFIRSPGRHIGEAVNLINAGIERGHLAPRLLDELAPLVEETTSQLIRDAKAVQDKIRPRWQSDEDYFNLRNDLGAWVDMIGIVPACDCQLLRGALELDDPLVNLFVVSALLTKGEEVPNNTIMKIARSYETLNGLYSTLKLKDSLHLFPDEYATFEHFAAAEMVGWLLYPTELGEEPTSIELKNTVDAQDDDDNLQRWCLWRFTDSEATAFAGVSGPYDQGALDDPTPSTVRSQEVFSNFATWDSATPEEHLSEILETLSNWRLAHREA